MARSPFPLQWPDGWTRARFRDRSKFDLSRGFPPARDGTYHQLDMMGASHEISYRYVKAERAFYVPEAARMQKKSENNKQGSSHEVVDDPLVCIRLMVEAGHHAFDVYDALLANGLAPELARAVLPVSTYTEWYWQCDLHNTLHLLRLRLDPHAQYEVRIVAQAMLDLIRPVYPTIIDAWERSNATVG